MGISPIEIGVAQVGQDLSRRHLDDLGVGIDYKGRFRQTGETGRGHKGGIESALPAIGSADIDREISTHRIKAGAPGQKQLAALRQITGKLCCQLGSNRNGVGQDQQAVA